MEEEAEKVKLSCSSEVNEASVQRELKQMMLLHPLMLYQVNNVLQCITTVKPVRQRQVTKEGHQLVSWSFFTANNEPQHDEAKGGSTR